MYSMNLPHIHIPLQPSSLSLLSPTHLILNSMFYFVLFHRAQWPYPHMHGYQVIHSGICHQTMTAIQKQSDSSFLSNQQLPKALCQICNFGIPSPHYDFQLTGSGKGLMQITSSSVSPHVLHPCCFPYIFVTSPLKYSLRFVEAVATLYINGLCMSDH